MAFNDVFDLTAQNMAAQLFITHPRVHVLVEELADLGDDDYTSDNAADTFVQLMYFAKACCHTACSYKWAVDQEKQCRS
jgi:hypothetical protein